VVERDALLPREGKDSSPLAQDDQARTAQPNERQQLSATVILDGMAGRQVDYEIDGETYSTPLILKGLHNAYNGAGALALVREILADGPQVEEERGERPEAERGEQPEADPALTTERDQRLVEALASVESAFGRGESFVFNGREIEMLLVKNAGGFSLALESFDCEDSVVMILVND
jgi:UDP-N-acetylmuramyl tripeptide synthase